MHVFTVVWRYLKSRETQIFRIYRRAVLLLFSWDNTHIFPAKISNNERILPLLMRSLYQEIFWASLFCSNLAVLFLSWDNLCLLLGNRSMSIGIYYWLQVIEVKYYEANYAFCRNAVFLFFGITHAYFKQIEGKTCIFFCF